MIVERVFAGKNINIERNGDALTIHGSCRHAATYSYRGSFACYYRLDANGRKAAVVAPGSVYSGSGVTQVEEAQVSLQDDCKVFLKLDFSNSSLITDYEVSSFDLLQANTEDTDYIQIAEVIEGRIHQCQFGPIAIWWRFFNA